MRRPIIAGNWKMNKTVDESIGLVQDICNRVKDITNIDVVLCPPFPSLSEVSRALKGSHIGLGAQNMHWEDEGAFTGEVSAKMLLTVGCQYVILGHSERRQLFGETDEGVHKKVPAALKSGLIPIICLGETIDERESGKTEHIVKRQLTNAVKGLSRQEMLKVIIAYEPVWAIGTGQSATPAMANEVHSYLRELVHGLYDQDLASAVRMQYGGSVNADNAASLFSQPDIDGALVGGASLKAESFGAIVLRGSQNMGG